MHLRSLFLFTFLLPSVARRSTRIINSRTIEKNELLPLNRAAPVIQNRFGQLTNRHVENPTFVAPHPAAFGGRGRPAVMGEQGWHLLEDDDQESKETNNAIFTVGRRAASLSAIAALLAPRAGSARVKGAAEMDLEFYTRGLIGQQTAPTPTAQAPRAARQLDARLSERFLSAVATGIAPSLATSAERLRERAAVRRQQLGIEYDRVLTVGAFGTGYDFTNGSIAARLPENLQYGFDLSVLAYFSLLADEKPARSEVAAASRRIGDELLAGFPQCRCAGNSASIGALLGGLRALLSELRTGGFISGFRVDDSDADEALWALRSDLSATKLTITLTDSATLRASLLLSGRGVSPELARPLLVSYLNSCGARVSDASEFFLDDYRESPLDYRPSQTLISFVVAPL